jgi:transketolase
MQGLSAHARSIRRKIVQMVSASKSSHVGSALSCVEILTALYFKAMNIDPKRPDWPGRDIFRFSISAKL